MFDEKKWMGYLDEAEFHLKNQSWIREIDR